MSVGVHAQLLFFSGSAKGMITTALADTAHRAVKEQSRVPYNTSATHSTQAKLKRGHRIADVQEREGCVDAGARRENRVCGCKVLMHG